MYNKNQNPNHHQQQNQKELQFALLQMVLSIWHNTGQWESSESLLDFWKVYFLIDVSFPSYCFLFLLPIWNADIWLVVGQPPCDDKVTMNREVPHQGWWNRRAERAWRLWYQGTAAPGLDWQPLDKWEKETPTWAIYLWFLLHAAE